MPAGAFGGKKGRAAAAKGIQNDVIALRRIQNGVGNQRNRLDRGMEVKSAFLTFARKAVGAGVVPHVRAIAPEAAELNVVEVRLLAVSKHEYELMPRPVKRAHAPVALNPNTQVKKIEASGATGGKYLAHVAPVHAGVDDGAAGGVRAGKLECFRQEARELIFAHLARGHRELAMLDRTAAADVTLYLDVIRGIGEHRRRFRGPKNGVVSRRIEGAAAIQAMVIREPKIANARYRRSNGRVEVIRESVSSVISSD